MEAIAITEGNTIKIGRDLVDAVSGRYKSHGKITVGSNASKDWVSTFPIAESESLLRREASKYGLPVRSFMSQSL